MKRKEKKNKRKSSKINVFDKFYIILYRFCSNKQFLKDLRRDLILHASGIIFTQPFSVISIRMMAQFVGRESIYK